MDANIQQELDFNASNNNIEAEVKPQDVTVNSDTEDTRPKSMFLSALDLLNDKNIKQSYLIEGLIAVGEVGLVVGPSDTGKSILTRQIALSIALKKDNVIDLKLNTKYNRSIVVSTEDNKASWKDKIEKYNLTKDERSDLSNLSIVFDEQFTPKALEEELKNNPADLVVIDVFTDLFTGDINNAISVRMFFKPYKVIAQKYGSAVIFIHHVSKKGEQSSPSKLNVSGSQGIEATMRYVLELRKDPNDVNARHLIITKGNNFTPQEKNISRKLKLLPTLEFENTGETASLENLGNTKSHGKDPAVIERVMELRAENLSTRGISEKLVEEGTPLHRTRVAEIIQQNK
ncbi:AAA family ATPase [Pedobacter sp. WC2501]|uniref:AAA family ATPase n=1 Tax=Pedobacter sp. WC2501 TaxID=3461400 RepID=UPI004045E6F4